MKDTQEAIRFMVSRPVQSRNSKLTNEAQIKAPGMSAGPILMSYRNASSIEELRVISDLSKEKHQAFRELLLRFAAELDVVWQQADGDNAISWESLERALDKSSLVNSEMQDRVRAVLFDALLLVTLDPSKFLGLKPSFLVKLIRRLEAISRIGDGNSSLESLSKIMRARVLLPRMHVGAKSVFVDRKPVEIKIEDQPKAKQGLDVEDKPSPTSVELEQLRFELENIITSATAERMQAVSITKTIQRSGLMAWLSWSSPNKTLQQKTKIVSSQELSPQGKSIFVKLGLSFDPNRVADHIIDIEKRLRPLSSTLAKSQNTLRSVQLGSSIISLSDLLASNPIITRVLPDVDLKNLDTSVSLPSGIGRIGLKQRGDLEIIRQRLMRYELGEIAHIENILKGENNERTISRTQTAETMTRSARESNSFEERDLQTTERFELQSEMKETVKDDLSLGANFSVSASYGPTVSIEAGSEFAYEHAQEKSKQAASQFARETTSKAISRLETRVSEQRSTRQVNEIRELNKHSIDNSKTPTGHVIGIYRWVNKIYEMQVVNYGLRDLYTLTLPDPAALWRFVQAGKSVPGLTLTEPELPMIGQGLARRMLEPSDLNDTNFDYFSALYGATDVPAPPEEYVKTSIVLEMPASTPETVGSPTGKISTELTIPSGYKSRWMKFDGEGTSVRGKSPYWVIILGGCTYLGRHGNDDGKFISKDIDFKGRINQLPVGLQVNDYFTLAVSVQLTSQRTSELYKTWQLSAYTAIYTAYQKQKATYDEQVAASQVTLNAGFQGRSPAQNLITIREELKRAAITQLSGQRFEYFNAMRPEIAPYGYPEAAFADAEAEGRYAAYFEQIFEWENMSYVFYPYYWGEKSSWPMRTQIDDIDPHFSRFLRAGFARIQIPVRPGFEASVDLTFAPENWTGKIWVGENLPGFADDNELSVTDELQLQTGGVLFVKRAGFVSINKGQAQITLRGAEFSDDDVDREIRVGNVDYRIVAKIDNTTIQIEEPYPSVDLVDSQYALGPKLVDLPWELVVPTSLIYLQSDDKLNPLG